MGGLAVRELTVAVVGCGRMGARTADTLRAAVPKGWLPLNHAEAVASLPGLRLVACCDRDPAMAKEAVGRYGGAPYTDYRDVLANGVPDIVTIATRTDGRAAMIAVCAEAGVRAIHAEKPLCRSIEEGEAAANAVIRNKMAFSFGATRRYMGAYRHARDIIQSGRFGEARQVLLNFRSGPLQWTHPHSVDLAMFFSGDAEPETAQAALMKSEPWDGKVLDADPNLAMGLLRFATGFTALLTAAPGCDASVICEKGIVSVLADGTAIECRAPTPGKGAAYFDAIQTEEIPSGLSGLQVALSELRDAILSGTPTSGGIHLALGGQRALFALALSGLNNGTEISLRDVPRDFTITGRFGDLYA
jgi:scyllo-inositol 2-dehydrogenase (NAD+)